MRIPALIAAAASIAFAGSPSAAGMVGVPAAQFPFPPGAESAAPSALVPAFRLDATQVSVRQFLGFVRSHPAYARSRIKRMLADTSYLASWNGDFDPPAGRLDEAVTEVSWYAAKAYCAERGARLPTTAEWERAASVPPAGMDSASYSRLILDWYARPAGNESTQGKTTLNALGIRDLHGKVWEWTSDFNAWGTAGPGAADASQTRGQGAFCGGSAGGPKDRTGYAAFMRYSFRASLQPSYTVKSLGFRCAR